MANYIAANLIADLEKMQNYNDYFDILPKHIKMKNGRYVLFFTRYWNKIPDKLFYDLYKKILCDVRRNNYFKELFNVQLERHIKKFNKHDTVDNEKLKGMLDENGYLTVYRGHSSYLLRNTASWTLSKDFAFWFGKRIALLNKTDGYYIYTGKVMLKDILAYITDKNEEEIVVPSKYVMDKKKEYFEFSI